MQSWSTLARFDAKPYAIPRESWSLDPARKAWKQISGCGVDLMFAVRARVSVSASSVAVASGRKS
jgi:hypothetical protein